MKKKLLILLLALASAAGVWYYGNKLLNGSPPVAGETQNNGATLGVEGDTLLLAENNMPVITVAFDSLRRIRPGYFQVFDTLVFRTDWYSNSQLNYTQNRNLALRSITGEKQTIIDFLRKTGMNPVPDTIALRQLLFRALTDSVLQGRAAGKTTWINNNKELVQTATPAAQNANSALPAAGRGYLQRLLVCAGILTLLALAAIFLNNKNNMRKKKRSESDEDFLKRTVYDLLGKDTEEARYFTEVLTGYKRYQSVKEQLKPEARTDTGSLIGNMKTAGLLTPTESKTMYELHEMKEKVDAIKSSGATPLEKQQHLLQLLQTLTPDEPLKQYFKEAEEEGIQWQKMMQLEEKDLPGALQLMFRFYDRKYGNGKHKLSPVYEETLRRAQLDIPVNFETDHRFLKALYQQYRNLLDDVYFTGFEQQHNEEKVAETRQTLVNRMAQLAFQAHSYLTRYNRDTAALPAKTIQANIQMVTEEAKVNSLAKETYKTYARDITRFEREIFMHKLLKGIGVNNLENVLLKDVYFPKESFEE